MTQPIGLSSGRFFNHPVFSMGFRPFFLLAGLQAALLVPVWLAQLLMNMDLGLPYSPALWHGHEMVFGFAGAAVAGFLLTAVPNWTATAVRQGPPVAALAGLWLAARIAFWCAGVLPPWIPAVLALAFFPAVASVLAGPLISAGKWRNMVFLPILGALTLADALVQAEMLGITQTGRSGLVLGIFSLLLMITIVGGRIIPLFTANGLRPLGIAVQPKARPRLDRWSIGLLVAAGLAVLIMPGGRVTGTLLFAASALHMVRLSGWFGWRTAPVPLLWVLHLGYLWLPFGLLLLGLSSFVPALRPEPALHALTVGCIGMMVLGVMSRVALGHTGRPLVAAKPTAVAYGLIFLAAAVRVFGVMIDYPAALWLSAALWSAGYLVFVTLYAPLCLQARADGR